MVNERELSLEAAANLKSLMRRDDITVKLSREGKHDVDINIGDIKMSGEVKNFVTMANFNRVIFHLQKIRENGSDPVLLIAGYISPQHMMKVVDAGFNVLDHAGNCYINIPPLYIHITGQKLDKPKETETKVFSESAIKLIFYFLLDKANVGKTYRKIAEETGYSLGTIKNVIEEMKRRHHIIKTPKGRVLMNWKKLLDEWQLAYNQSLKPKLFLKKMRLRNPKLRLNWKKIKLPKNSYWGGESGAYLTDGYLVPEILTIYTDGDSVDMIKTGQMAPSPDGDILVYKKFWSGETENNIVPRILTYADLMGTTDSRCLEAAKRIINNEK
ncbi:MULTISPECIES: type IV toxin-antitoxin system AbiEi family antitoxin [Prevotella]|uniref:Uncharacterized protein n=1 Tax=Prevotella herbatica TaxID=2801997 RepID=A0ABN6EFJ4_9BACT|nr:MULTISPECIES: type IV toxin-antitoxin system AbiEi family antitoxin [Prevotella]MDN5554685.1 hypothetical protein [Prevotella sp.]BCS84683.1 hypothetical protein prwr041_05760 [Prevotella herbatica]